MKRKINLISQQMASQRKRLLLLAVFSVALGAAIVTQAALLAEAVQRIFVQEASLASVVKLLIMLLAMMAVRTLLSYGNGRIGLQIAASVKTNMRAKVLHNLVHASMNSSLDGQTGGKVSVALDAVDEADSYFSHYLPRMMESAIIPILILLATFALHVNSGLILLFTAPFIPIFMILVGMKTKTKSEEKFAQLAEFSGTFLDSVQGMVTLKLFGRSRRQQQEIERSSLSFMESTMGILRIAFTNTFMLESIVMLSMGIVALELAIQLLVFHSLNFHTAFFVLLLVPEFFSLLKNAGTAFHGGRTSMGAIRKVEELLAETERASCMRDGREGTDSAHGAKELGSSGNYELAKKDLFPRPPSLQLDLVRFRHKPDSFELATRTVVIGQGENIAIVGKSGSGKTTLLHLMAGLLIPESGEIRVNGNPLSHYDEEAWFESISYITQHPYIFAGTLAENIAIGTRRNASRNEIEQAAAEAGLSVLAAQLEEGYDTLVGEGGRGLSGGEKQRLALARAFLKRPAVILFDEPTVGLDLYTERILQKSIASLAKTATMITVAHRLYTIQHADKILFMDNGVLIDSGSHDELLERMPPYAEMVNLQRNGGLA